MPLLWGTFVGWALVTSSTLSIFSDIKRTFCNQWQPHISKFSGPISILYPRPPHPNHAGWLRTCLVTGMRRSPGCCDFVWFFQTQIRFLTVTWICSSCPLITSMRCQNYSTNLHCLTLLPLTLSPSNTPSDSMPALICPSFLLPPVYLAALHQQRTAVNQTAVCQPRHQWFANEMFLINPRPPCRPSRLTLKHTGNVDPQICCRILSECVQC